MPRPKKTRGEPLVPRSYRFSPLYIRLLRELAEREGLGDTAFLEMTIRRLAREYGLDMTEKNNGDEIVS